MTALIAGVLVAAGAEGSQAEAQSPTCFGEPATIIAEPGVPTVGTDGDDVIVGTAGPDVIRGGPGSDLICGYGGDDLIRGNRGRDRIKGGPGADELRGGKGDDELIGKKGHDRLFGKSGNDSIRGNRGHDQIWGGRGSDQIWGGKNRDVCVGGVDDTISSCEAVYSGKAPDYSSGWVLRSTALTGGGGVVAGTAAHGYVVMGVNFGGDGLYSRNGISWQRIALPGATERVLVRHVAASGKGFVAVAMPSSVSRGMEYEPWLWYSPDGRNWDRIDPATLPLSTLTNGAVQQVTASERGFAATVVDDCSILVWFSENGRNWSESTFEEGCWAVELAASDRGWTAIAAMTGEPSVFASSNGRTWTAVEVHGRSAPPTDVLAGRLAAPRSFIADGDTLVLPRDVRVWVSTNGGRSWTTKTFRGRRGVGTDFPMIATDRGFVGSRMFFEGGQRHHNVVSSPNGRAWIEQAMDFRVRDLAAAGQTIVAIGPKGSVYTWAPER